MTGALPISNVQCIPPASSSAQVDVPAFDSLLGELLAATTGTISGETLSTSTQNQKTCSGTKQKRLDHRTGASDESDDEPAPAATPIGSGAEVIAFAVPQVPVVACTIGDVKPEAHTLAPADDSVASARPPADAGYVEQRTLATADPDLMRSHAHAEQSRPAVSGDSPARAGDISRSEVDATASADFCIPESRSELQRNGVSEIAAPEHTRAVAMMNSTPGLTDAIEAGVTTRDDQSAITNSPEQITQIDSARGTTADPAVVQTALEVQIPDTLTSAYSRSTDHDPEAVRNVRNASEDRSSRTTLLPVKDVHAREKGDGGGARTRSEPGSGSTSVESSVESNKASRENHSFRAVTETPQSLSDAGLTLANQKPQDISTATAVNHSAPNMASREPLTAPATASQEVVSRNPESIAEVRPDLPTASPSVVHSVRMLDRLGRSEMHIGLNTELGRVDVRTVVHDSQIGATISVERRELGAALAAELPRLEQALHNQQIDARVTVHDASGGMRGGFHGQHEDRQQPPVPAPMFKSREDDEPISRDHRHHEPVPISQTSALNVRA